MVLTLAPRPGGVHVRVVEMVSRRPIAATSSRGAAAPARARGTRPIPSPGSSRTFDQREGSAGRQYRPTEDSSHGSPASSRAGASDRCSSA